VFVEFWSTEWAAYFAAFDQPLVPDDIGNLRPGAETV
jgi:hypothetical protein